MPHYIAAALSERIGRPITVEELGMGGTDHATPRGWEFPRDRDDALATVQAYWSDSEAAAVPDMFSAAAYTVPVTRWLAVPADRPQPSEGERRVGREDVQELRDAAEQARLWDATFGGGDWRLSSVTRCLAERAMPLLSGTYTERVGRDLLTTVAELSRVAAWAAFDSGHHGTAQQRFIQALRLARAGGDVEMGTYILTTMALHTVARGAPDQALDMAQGAYTQGSQHASPRALAFAKLAEARAYGRLGDAPSASSALSRAERLLDKITSSAADPPWLSYVTYGRLAADATAIFRDLRNPEAALKWNHQATQTTPLPHPRARGLRFAAVATAHCQAGDVDAAMQYTGMARDALTRVRSARAEDCLRGIGEALAPWATDPRVEEFLHRRSQPTSDAVVNAAPKALSR